MRWQYLQIAAAMMLLTAVSPVAIFEDSYDVISGNVTFAVVTEVNNLGNDVCGSVDVNSLQNLVAVTWFLERANANGYIPGVTIGLDAYRTCGQTQRAASHVVKMMTKYSVGESADEISKFLFGIQGPSRTSEAMTVSRLIGQLPANQQVLQVSGSSTGKELSNKDLYPNFFRVIPPDNVQVETILELLSLLKWNYIAIVYDDDDYGRSAAAELRRLGKERLICDMLVEGYLPLDSKSDNFTKQAQNISQMIKSNNVGGVVVLGIQATTKEFLRLLAQSTSYPQLILSEGIGLNKDTLTDINGAVETVAKGALITSPVYINVQEFTDFWPHLWTNKTLFLSYSRRLPWLEAYLMEKGQYQSCATNVSECWDQSGSARNIIGGISPNLYVSYELLATALMMAKLKQAHSSKCSVSPGLCEALKTYIQERHELISEFRSSPTSINSVGLAAFANKVLSFDQHQDVNPGQGVAEYSVYNWRTEGANNFSFHQVGSYANNHLSIDANKVEFYDGNSGPLSMSTLPPAQCPENRNCLQCVRDVSNDVLLLENDRPFYFIGLVPVSEKNTHNLLGCGEIKGLAGADLAQSLIYAVNYVNSDLKDVLPNNNVSLVVMNTCGSPMHVRQQLMDFYSGKMPLPDGTNSSRILDRVIGVVGAHFSANSIATSDTLTNLNLPSFIVLSPGSSSVDLKDRQKHPYFMRLVPADDQQAKAMLDITIKLGGNYIQVIYDKTTAYASSLNLNLHEETVAGGGSYNVCIAQSIPTEPQTDGSLYNFIVEKLREYPSAKIVVLILHPTVTAKVLDSILRRLSSSDNFLFLGSESWGRRPEIIEGKPSLKGSLVLAQEIARNPLFEDYFKNLGVISEESAAVKTNPWLARFWEARKNCYMEKSFMREGRQRCSSDFAHTYEQDALVPFSIQAVYALARGFHAALKTSNCGNSICPQLTSQLLVDSLKQVKLDLYYNNQKEIVFDSNGDGLVPFKLLRVSSNVDTPDDDNDVTYTDVGSWSPSEGLTLKSPDAIQPPSGDQFSSICPNTLACQLCFQSKKSGGSSPQSGETVSTNNNAVIGVAVAATVVIIILAIVLIVVFVKARRTGWKKENLTNKHFSQHSYMDLASAGSQNSAAHDSGQHSTSFPMQEHGSVSPRLGTGRDNFSWSSDSSNKGPGLPPRQQQQDRVTSLRTSSDYASCEEIKDSLEGSGGESCPTAKPSADSSGGSLSHSSSNPTARRPQYPDYLTAIDDSTAANKQPDFV